MDNILRLAMLKFQGHACRPPLSHMVDIKINSLFLYISVVVEGNILIFRTISVGEDRISLDLPQGDPHVVG